MVEQIRGGSLGAKTLEIPMAGGSRKQVQPFDVAGRVVVVAELVT
jgi:hypothetical protein